MTDDDLERMLSAWRPASPPPALRRRVLASTTPVRVWPLALAAATLAGVVVLLPRATDALAAQVVTTPPAIREAMVDVLAGAGVERAAAERLAEAALAETAVAEAVHMEEESR